MKYTILKGTDLVVSEMALGTGTYASEVPADLSEEMLTAYYDIGGTFYDTAHIYGRYAAGDRSLSELLIGKWLKKQNIKRDSIVLSSKGCSNTAGIRAYKRLKPEFLKEDFEESLRNLGTDHLDFYYLHQDDVSQPVEPMIDALNNYVREGKLCYFGCSNWSIDRMRAAQDYAKATGQMGFAATQLMYNMAFPNLGAIDSAYQLYVTDRMMQYLISADMPLFAYSAQCRGYFNQVFTKEFRIDSRKERTVKFFDNSENLIRAQRAQVICEETGMTMGDVILGYVMSQPIQCIPVVQPNTMSQFESTFHSIGARLTPEQMRFIMEN